MSSNRRRQYAKQQLEAYANPDYAEPTAPQEYGYPAESGGGSGMFIPGAPTPDSVAQGVDQMGFNGPYGGAPAYGAYGSGPAYSHAGSSAQLPVVPLNELFNIDVMQAMPPPVNELDFPPPPLAVPVEAAASRSEYANASPDYIRSTLNVIPATNSLLRKSKLPFAVVIRPFNALVHEDEGVPLQDDLVVARCRRCRSYIHPFVEFIGDQNQWRCSICGLTNSVPSAFDYDAARTATKNRHERPELNYGVVEYVANADYLARPPQPPTYIFLIDVSVNATSAGLVELTAKVLRDSLDKLPNKDGRTRVAFIAVDGALNYFQLQVPDAAGEPPGFADESGEPKPVRDARMLVVSDLDDPFLPSPTGLLVNLKESRPQIEQFLEKLPHLFAQTVVSSNALGAGLKAALKLIANVGGKIICITASLPTVGPGKLDVRDDARAQGNRKTEIQLLSPQSSFYKNFAVDCNRSQASVDMFLLSSRYQDVASLSNLPKYTAGSTYYFPAFNANNPSEASKFAHQLTSHLSQEIGLEGMIRVRASSGIRSSSFMGHFFVRSSDLMTFPTIPREQGYVVELNIDETITKPFVTLQAAFLYTTAFGERRIRVMTLQIPTSDKIGDIYASADQQAIASWYAHQASEKVVSSGVVSTQEWMNARIAELLKTYRADVLNSHSGSGSSLSISSNLKLLPLLMYAIKKTIALQASLKVSSDVRSEGLDLLTTLPLPYLIKYIYPEFYALHDLPEEAGMPDENGRIVLPARLNLSGESLQGHGLYLLDDGQKMFLWIGRDVVPELLLDAFGTDDLERAPVGRAEVPVVPGSLLNQQMRNLIEASRSNVGTTYYPSLYIVRGNTGKLREWASSLLVEDRTETEPTYHQYLTKIRES